jgi:hypothetical protein
VAKNEEGEHELHVPMVKPSRDNEPHVHVLKEVSQMGSVFPRRLPGRFICFAPISYVSPLKIRAYLAQFTI